MTTLGGSSGAAAPIFYTDLLARPRPAATKIVSYGPAEQQRGSLFLPTAKGPHPVVVLIHGGCWLAKLPGPELMDYAAADLQHRGYAVWNIGYRRLGHDGGGYPGTFLDVGRAIDALQRLAPDSQLDLTRIVLAGHSAGGQLALWAAARPHLPNQSPLYHSRPLTVRGVVSLSGILDLEDYRAHGAAVCGGPKTIDRLTGATARGNADVYADTSPARLLPIGVPYAIISADLDEIVPPEFGTRFAAKARAAKEAPHEIIIAGAGHFELIDPQSAAWKRIVAEIDRLSRR
ncbi:MAG: alpha/beta hydrolase [Alphaproteobacteria bacterium]|nr:alpha/beta hydrolase [Alphaproteobacteria bacterium]